MSGSLNWVIFLSFKDSVEWVFRSPRTGMGDLSLEVAGELLESEVATMKYIKSNTFIPVPDVFDYRLVNSKYMKLRILIRTKALLSLILLGFRSF